MRIFNRFLLNQKGKRGTSTPLTVLLSTLVLCLPAAPGCQSSEQAKAFLSKVSNLQTAGISPPTILSPSSSPTYTPATLTVSGKCQSGATVYLADSSSSASVACSSTGTFTLNASKPSDGTYPFIVYQVDSSRRSSDEENIQWIRDSHVPGAPSITFPLSSTYHSANTVTISGTCTDNHFVEMTGDDSQTVSCNSSSFSFLVTKSVDGTYNFTLKQVSLAGISSTATASQTWVRDSAAPSVNLLSSPPALEISNTTASFSFNSTETATFECKLDAGSFSSCTSPKSYTSLSNGAHTFTFRATDLALNTTTSSPYNWTQAVYNTVALYHFDASGFSADSSNYGSTIYTNNLTNSGTTATSGSGGVFSTQGRIFTSASSNYMSVADNPTHALLSTQMTIEGFFRFISEPSGGGRYVFVSKKGSSGQFGWEFGARDVGSGNQRLYFAASPDGTTSPTEISSSTINFGTSSYRYVAVTVNSGAVTLYFNSSSSAGTGNLGFSTINNPSVPIQLGASNTALFLNSNVDEIRISNMIRTISIPGSAFSAD